MQSTGTTRKASRRSFRKMAKDMANRYLRRMPIFSERSLTTLSSLLAADDPQPKETVDERHLEAVAATQNRLKISENRRRSLDVLIAEYFHSAKVTERPGTASVDVRSTMLQILMHRYSKRTKGPRLFAGDDPDPSRPLKADGSVYDSACLHLLHRNGRPYYYGVDKLCDAGSENAELFLHLAGALVERSATQLIQANRALLTPATQNHVLRQRASEIIDKWNFPWHLEVRRLVQRLGTRCTEITLEPNAWLAPNAFGILQSEFDLIVERDPQLAAILQFAVAYNAVSLNPRYGCKGETWCLVELGGIGIIHHGLTLIRGGFLEGSIADLNAMVKES